MLQYCLVLEVGCEDPGQGVGNEVLCQQADAEVRVLTSCDAGLARNRRRRSCERRQGNGGVLGERGGVTLVPARGGAPSPERWREGAAGEAVPSLQRAGVVLANLGVPSKDGEVGGGGEDPAAEAAAANGDQQLENECATQEPLPWREPDRRRVLQSAADEYFAAGPGGGLERAGAEEEEEQQMPMPGDEYWGSERAENALRLRGVLAPFADPQCQEVLDLVQMKTQSVGVCCPSAGCSSESFQRAAGFDSK